MNNMIQHTQSPSQYLETWANIRGTAFIPPAEFQRDGEMLYSWWPKSGHSMLFIRITASLFNMHGPDVMVMRLQANVLLLMLILIL